MTIASSQNESSIKYVLSHWIDLVIINCYSPIKFKTVKKHEIRTGIDVDR